MTYFEQAFPYMLWATELYLGRYQKSLIEHFCENSKAIWVVNYFHKVLNIKLSKGYETSVVR